MANLMDAFETLTYDKRDGVAWVTLNRPEVLNAIDLRMRDDLWSVLDAIELDPDVRAVVFRGAGRNFSSGADLNDFGTAPSIVEARRGRTQRDLWGRLSHLEKPLIAAVRGYAYGAGCELALLCDLRLAAADALFCLPEVKLGYLPTAGGSQTLPRTIGPGRALDMILTADPIPAARALDYGLVQWVVPALRLDAEAESLAQRLLSRPSNALRAAKLALAAAQDLPLADGLRLEARLSGALVASPAAPSS